MIQKMYVDEPDDWKPIDEAQACKELECYYRNVGEVVDFMKIGGKARTPFAFYRWTLGSVPTPTQDTGTHIIK